jgi:hypothetical protein
MKVIQINFKNLVKKYQNGGDIFNINGTII